MSDTWIKNVSRNKTISSYIRATQAGLDMRFGHLLRLGTWRVVWENSTFTASSESRLSSKASKTCNTILYFDRVQGHGLYAGCIDQYYLHVYHANRPFCFALHEFKSQWMFFIKLTKNKVSQA